MVLERIKGTRGLKEGEKLPGEGETFGVLIGGLSLTIFQIRGLSATLLKACPASGLLQL